MRWIDLDASGWTTILDFHDALLVALGAPEWHGRSAAALNDPMIWGEINAVEPPYAVRISASGTVPDVVIPMAFVVEALDARMLRLGEGKLLIVRFHPLDLAVRPRMARLYQAMLDVEVGAGGREGVAAERHPAGAHGLDLCRGPSIAGRPGEARGVAGEHRVDLVWAAAARARSTLPAIRRAAFTCASARATLEVRSTATRRSGLPSSGRLRSRAAARCRGAGVNDAANDASNDAGMGGLGATVRPQGAGAVVQRQRRLPPEAVPT